MQLFSSWFSSGKGVLQDLIHEYECLKDNVSLLSALP